MTRKDPLYQALTLQRRAKEEREAFSLSQAEASLKEAEARRASVQEALSLALRELPSIEPGRQTASSLKRAFAAKEKVEAARRALTQAQRQELLARQQHQEALRHFTAAAQSRILIEREANAKVLQQEKILEKKQEEEQEEAWQLLRHSGGSR